MVSADASADVDAPPDPDLDPPPGSVLRVVRGSASAPEIAALTAVLLAIVSGGSEGSAGSREDGLRRGGEAAWGNRSALLRRSLPPGPHAWRASSRPG